MATTSIDMTASCSIRVTHDLNMTRGIGLAAIMISVHDVKIQISEATSAVRDGNPQQHAVRDQAGSRDGVRSAD